MDNYIGRLLDNRYEILDEIGCGGMAMVYKARCHRLNRLVAIKILKDELFRDSEFRRRFHAESQAVAMLSHPNIVNVYDVSHSENADYIVMELIDGITLKQYMEQKGTLNWREALHFTTQIAKALDHAHSRGIIHRDIKPHNIMILKDGSVKVADFGIARVSSAQSTLTREALGSVHYISPEQAKGSKIDYRSDLYSLGVVLYEMLTGVPPYDGETPVSVAIQHINAQAVLPRTRNPQIPAGLEQITMHAMCADIEERYTSAAEMLLDLDEFRKNPSVFFEYGSIPSSEDAMPAPGTISRGTLVKKTAAASSADQRRSSSSGIIAGVICILLALGAIGYFLYAFFLSDLFTVPDDVSVPFLQGEIAAEIDPADYPDFIITVVGEQPHETIEKGRVISQTPAGGRMVKPGATIELTVSAGLLQNVMQDLTSHTEESAITLLDNLRLNLNIIPRYEASNLYAGTVIRTDPAANTELTEGQTVILYISAGSNVDLIIVKNFIGQHFDDASKWIEDNDLICTSSYVASEEPLGTVLEQSVPEDTQVKKNTVISLTISDGSLAQKPNVPDNGIPQDRLIQLPMPDSDESVTVTVRVDGMIPEVLPPFDVELSTLDNNSCPIALRNKGVHTITVYIDDILWHTMEYDFDTGEIIG